jgi:hypothetical protein
MTKSRYEDYVVNGGTVRIFGKNLNESKLEQTEVRECLLTFGAESFVFYFAIQNI